MADELTFHRFVAAVFRDPADVAVTIARLCEDSFAAGQFFILVSHEDATMRQALERNGVDGVPIATLEATESLEPELGSGFRELFDKLEAIKDQPRKSAAPPGPRVKEHPIYSRLPQELARGAFVLILTVNDAEQQLRGARIVLRGNSECVLTHELALSEPEDRYH